MLHEISAFLEKICERFEKAEAYFRKGTVSL